MDGNNNGWGPWWNVPIGPEHELPIGVNATGQAVRKLWPPPGEWEGPGHPYGMHQIQPWDLPAVGAYAELCRRLEAINMVIVAPESCRGPFRIRRAEGALLAINRINLPGAGPLDLVTFQPIDRLIGQRHGSPLIRAVMAELARQVACLWWVMPRTVVGVSVYVEQDPMRGIHRWDDLIVRCLMIHDFPEVGESMLSSECRIAKDVIEDVDYCYMGSLLDNWTRHLLTDVEDWGRGNGGRTWQPILEDRRDREAEERGYKEAGVDYE